ncbi:cupin domain-containing protein [Candidatus Dojkabacteria bacterium]|uniref:Cupin domain-containing protein n=1 Tax=Candidatus Dojkabacteria bacterium TaxID=2099670 RepID=A0A955L8N4_9BACT|nr:cupin domain-containing protein [Candidatus Dojkabacteria bacterium]
MKVIKAEDLKTMPGPKDWFTGDVKVTMLFPPITSARAAGAEVTFQPGARTAWHTHPYGQTLIVTSGTGWIQREGEEKQVITKGDIIQFEPGEKHWHGATSDTEMTHIAIQEGKDGVSVDWMEHVADEDYLG